MINIRKRIFIIFLAAALMLTFCACDAISDPENTEEPQVTNAPPEKPAYPVSFDNESFDCSPETAVSLSPAVTEILDELGLSDRLIGVSDYCYRHENAETVGSPANPDLKKIIELSPELLITQSPLASADVVKLKQAGIRYLYLEKPKSLAYLCEEYIKLAMIFYGAVDSQDIAVNALSLLDSSMLEAENADINRDFIIVTGERDGIYTISAGSDIQTDILSVFGKNILDGRESAFISKDELKELECSLVFADDEIDRGEISDIFDGKAKIIKTDLKAFERPTAALYETVKYCLAELG